VFLRNLDQLLPRLEVLLGADLLVLAGAGHGGVLVLLAASCGLLTHGLEHDDAGGALGAGGDSQVGARLDEEVGDVVLLAEDGEVHDDVHGGDVAGDDDEAGDVG